MTACGHGSNAMVAWVIDAIVNEVQRGQLPATRMTVSDRGQLCHAWLNGTVLPALVRYVPDRRLLSRDGIRHCGIGHHGERYVIPVSDGRRHDMNSASRLHTADAVG